MQSSTTPWEIKSPAGAGLCWVTGPHSEGETRADEAVLDVMRHLRFADQAPVLAELQLSTKLAVELAIDVFAARVVAQRPGFKAVAKMVAYADFAGVGIEVRATAGD